MSQLPYGEQTVETRPSSHVVDQIGAGQGRLIQIHPLDLNTGPICLPLHPFTIGRDEQCDLTIEDSSVSRRHAVIEPSELACVVSDLESTNGTYVNERQVASEALAAGDRVRIGSHIFKYLSSAHVEAQYHETIYSMMTQDGLTGAYNKRYLLDVLHREIERSRRHHRPMSLVMMDIDHFKAINDTYGHLAGDEVLQEFCRRLMELLRSDEVFARYGGEEFALVMGEVEIATAAHTAERCRRAIETLPFETSAGDIRVTASFGVAQTCGETSASPASLIKAADEKLYEAKTGGRNRVC